MEVKYRVLKYNPENGSVDVNYYLVQEDEGIKLNIRLPFNGSTPPTESQALRYITGLAPDASAFQRLSLTQPSYLSNYIGVEKTFIAREDMQTWDEATNTWVLDQAAYDAYQAGVARKEEIAITLPTWAQVSTAIDNISNLAEAKVFIKKLARVVYLGIRSLNE